MSKTTITTAVRKRGVLVSDGGWGTFLQLQGLQPGDCPEAWCLERPEVIANIAQSYITAGADMIQTNSFGGSRFKLAQYELHDQVTAINKAAAAISRRAAGDDHWVIASIGPTGKLLMMEEVTVSDLQEAFAEQALALADGGADALCIETMMAIDEAEAAVRAAKQATALEVICTFTFQRTVQGEFRTMMGASPAEAASAAVAAGADIIGANCGTGISGMLEIVKEMRAVELEKPVLVHANAGMPVTVQGKDVFPETAQQMADAVPELIAAGANIIGGCCGTTPEHIAAIARKLGR